MVNNRIGFEAFVKKSSGEVRLILDSNIIIPYFDEDHDQHDLVSDFINGLDEKVDANITFHTTVTTKSEFLEYQRRRFLTQGLLDLVDEVNKGRGLSQKAKSSITSQKGQLKRRRDKSDILDEEKIDLDHFRRYFKDTEIKKIKKAFRARTVQEERGWLEICRLYLAGKLVRQETLIDELCEYISPNDPEQQIEFFGGRQLDWKEATRLCSNTGMGYADAMIFNLFRESTIQNLATLDFDLVYGVSVDAKDKTVLLPNSRLKQFKKPLKNISKN